ncbi:MAG: hypothetical protein JSS76_04655 [Bacteroidetes bacterium]|nr:hypothetical protein [Bacteroidota bacterium]
MKAVKRNSALWAYLEGLGKTDACGDELRALKAEYRRLYMKSYKRNERRRNQHYTLSFKRTETEIIRKAAKEHNLTENTLMKKAISAYLTSSFVIRDKIVLDRILQALLRCQSSIQQIQDRDKGRWFKADNDYENLSKVVAKIREEVTEAFANPPKLYDEIVSAIKRNPDFINTLRSIVDEHS